MLRYLILGFDEVVLKLEATKYIVCNESYLLGI